METYCVRCRKKTENLNWIFKKILKKLKTRNDRLIMQLKCADCRIKKSRFAKEQEAKGLLSKLGIKTPR